MTTIERPDPPAARARAHDPTDHRGLATRLLSAFRGFEASIRGRRPAVAESRDAGAGLAGTPPGVTVVETQAPPPAVVAPVVDAPPVIPPRRSIGVESVIYKQTNARALHMTIVRPAGTDPAPGRPCVLFFHGGGWRRGTPQQFLPYCTLLAQRGVVGMTAEYRLLEGVNDEVPVHAVADARSAMRWVRVNAGRFGVDPARIAAGGGSSGAHLAVMAAMNSPVDDAADDLSIDPRPAALILLNPPCNFDAYASSVPITQRRLYSPFHLLDDSLPPTLMLHGTADRVIPFSQITEFQLRARSVGARQLKVVPFEGRGHGFFNRGKGEPGDFMRSAVEIGHFLGGLGWM
jgi:acetyl esterase/lipase